MQLKKQVKHNAFGSSFFFPILITTFFLLLIDIQDDKKVKKNDEDEGITLGGDVCNCRKSKCLKLYCQCFNAAKVCNFACHCIECCNTENHEKERRDAVKAILDRNPTAFDSKFLVVRDQAERLDVYICPPTTYEAPFVLVVMLYFVFATYRMTFLHSERCRHTKVAADAGRVFV